MVVINLDDYSTPEAVAKLRDIDPEFEEALKERPGGIIDLSDIPALRVGLQAMEEHMITSLPPPPETAVKQVDVTVPLRDGASTNGTLVYPAAAQAPKDGSPVVVMWHGGGFTLCSHLQVLPRAWGLAQLFGCAVLCANYRLAPENPFPTGWLDAWDTVIFASEASNFSQYEGLKVNHAKGFIIGGLSAGANFGAALAQKAKDENLMPKLTGQYIGWIGASVIGDAIPDKYKHLWFSTSQNADDPTQKWEDVVQFIKLAQIDLLSPLFNPLNTPGQYPEQFAGLPKAFYQIGGSDSLRDDGLVHARVMRDAGVETLVMIYPGWPHASSLTHPDLKGSREQTGDTARGFAWMLGLKDGEWDAERADDLMAHFVASK